MPEVRRPSGTDARARAAPRLIYIATKDWSFLSHCLAMARAARAAGFEVHVAANVTENAAAIRDEGFILHAVRFGRGRLSPLRTLRTISTLRHLYRLVDPAIVHHVAMEPALLGIAASFGSAFAAVYAVAGLQPLPPAAKRRWLRPGRRLLLPSRGGEGVPRSLLEAAAFGRPLIATDVPGCREIVIHEKTGLLVPVDDPQALASAILRLVRSPPQRVRFGVAARRLVDERFAADLVGQATVALYQPLLAL
jgi:glycosyltransferase involved in cell wall biosynthesis